MRGKTAKASSSSRRGDARVWCAVLLIMDGGRMAGAAFRRPAARGWVMGPRRGWTNTFHKRAQVVDDADETFSRSARPLKTKRRLFFFKEPPHLALTLTLTLTLTLIYWTKLGHKGRPNGNLSHSLGYMFLYRSFYRVPYFTTIKGRNLFTSRHSKSVKSESLRKGRRSSFICHSTSLP